MFDRTDQPRSEDQPPEAMRVAGSVPGQLLLPVLPGDGGESGADAADGRDAFAASGVWQSQAGGAAAPGRFGHQPQAGGAAAAVDGDRGDLRQAPDQPARVGAPDLSVSGSGGAGWRSRWG